jgi:branched-chain amino acid transport system permease protein
MPGSGRVVAVQVVGWLALALALFAAWLLVSNDYYLRLLDVAGIYIIAAIPFGLLMGQMGYLAMGQAGFFGVGAFVVANLTVVRFALDFWPALIAAIAVVAALAFVLSFPLFRLRAYHFAIGTLAVGQLLWLVFDSWEWFTGGSFGANGIPRPAIGAFETASNASFYVLVAVFAYAAALISWLINRGHVGRALRAIRQDEDLASARGLDVLWYKRFVFVYAAVFAGIAGALFGPLQISIDPSSFTIWSSFEFVIYALVGGAGALFGPALGVIAVTLTDQAIQDFGKWNQLVFGVLIVVIVLFFPGGLWGGMQSIGRRLAAWTFRRGEARPVSQVAGGGAAR